MNKLFWGVFSVGTLLGLTLFFQNCSKTGFQSFEQNSSSSSSQSSQNINHEQVQLNRLTSQDAINVDMRFEAYGAEGTALYNWFYTLNGVASGCTEKGSNTATTYTINCTQSGPLAVGLILTQSGTTQTLTYTTILNPATVSSVIPLEVTFEIPAGTNKSPWNTAAAVVETFVGQTLKIKNMDSTNHQLHTNNRPCGHGNAIAPGASADCVISQTYNRTANGPVYDHIAGTAANFYLVSYSGPELYAANCQSCHKALAMSDYPNVSVEQISNAIQNVAAMKTPALMSLTLRQKQAIAYALKK